MQPWVIKRPSNYFANAKTTREELRVQYCSRRTQWLCGESMICARRLVIEWSVLTDSRSCAVLAMKHVLVTHGIQHRLIQLVGDTTSCVSPLYRCCVASNSPSGRRLDPLQRRCWRHSCNAINLVCLGRQSCEAFIICTSSETQLLHRWTVCIVDIVVGVVLRRPIGRSTSWGRG